MAYKYMAKVWRDPESSYVEELMQEMQLYIQRILLKDPLEKIEMQYFR